MSLRRLFPSRLKSPDLDEIAEELYNGFVQKSLVTRAGKAVATQAQRGEPSKDLVSQ